MSGIVTDVTRAVVPGVRVTARSAETGRLTSATTNDRGLFVLASLPVGEYTVEAEKEGFKKYGASRIGAEEADTGQGGVRCPGTPA